MSGSVPDLARTAVLLNPAWPDHLQNRSDSVLPLRPAAATCWCHLVQFQTGSVGSGSDGFIPEGSGPEVLFDLQVPGVSDLQKYLRRFGVLRYRGNAGHQVQVSRLLCSVDFL